MLLLGGGKSIFCHQFVTRYEIKGELFRILPPLHLYLTILLKRDISFSFVKLK